jgi:methionine synthase I (cobalamin-dependent)
LNLLSLLDKKSVLLLDGAMGTELDKRGLMSRGANNLESPEAVREIHQRYVQSGCDVLTTNTLTTNRIYIETHEVGVSIEAVNRAGVELAGQAAG